MSFITLAPVLIASETCQTQRDIITPLLILLQFPKWQAFSVRHTIFVDSESAILLNTSSTLFRSDVHFSLLSVVSFSSLACLRATFLCPDFRDANADFLDLQKENKVTHLNSICLTFYGKNKAKLYFPSLWSRIRKCYISQRWSITSSWFWSFSVVLSKCRTSQSRVEILGSADSEKDTLTPCKEQVCWIQTLCIGLGLNWA